MADKQAGGGTVRDQAKGRTGNRDITKAVLASPLVIPWPSLPRNYQTAVMQELPRLVPESIAAYHTDRARCHVERKKAARKQVRLDKAPAPVTVGDHDMDKGGQADEAQAGPSQLAISGPPTKPEMLDHLVLGINETIKSLERSIDELKLRLLMMADRLNGIHLKPGSNLLQTAPRSRSKSPSPPPPAVDTPTEASPPAFIVIPLLSISPQSLVAPIPQYAATYNSLVWQWGQLSRIVKTRLKEADWRDVLGEEREEVRVVALGRVEGELAAMVGLRRLACLTVKRSHPDLGLLEKVLPKSVLHPPRHALTLPFPQSDLRVHTGDEQTSIPQPHVHYAPLTIKGITTSTPVDANSRKKKRLEEVRQKRQDAKAKRKVERQGGGESTGKKMKQPNVTAPGKVGKKRGSEGA